MTYIFLNLHPYHNPVGEVLTAHASNLKIRKLKVGGIHLSKVTGRGKWAGICIHDGQLQNLLCFATEDTFLLSHVPCDKRTLTPLTFPPHGTAMRSRQRWQTGSRFCSRLKSHCVPGLLLRFLPCSNSLSVTELIWPVQEPQEFC